MNDQDFAVRFAKAWFKKSECPGCRTPLEQVAGRGVAHTRTGHILKRKWWLISCSWSADDLSSLVILARRRDNVS